jgi:putative Mg2+ transporter-C (MgtC) family protein
VFHTDLHLLARVAIACAIAFAFGFERQLRGSPAGNRTFVLIGGTAAAVTSVAGLTSPQAVAGILTGIGFIGAGLVFIHGATVRGLTSAATVFGVAGIGIVLGYGHLWLGLFIGAAFLLILELQHIPGLRFLDASAIAARFADDFETPLRLEPDDATTPADDAAPSSAVGSAEIPTSASAAPPAAPMAPAADPAASPSP